MKRLMPAGLITFLQNNRNMMEADLFVIQLPNGETIYATSGQWDITVPSGAGGWSGPQTTFYANKYGRWSRGTITSEASFNMSTNTMGLTCLPQPTTEFPGNPVGLLNAALNGLFDAAYVTVYTAYFAMGQYGKLAGGVPPTLIAHAAAAESGISAGSATTPTINTIGANFIVVVVQSDLTTNGVLTDNLGNTWTAVPITGGPFAYAPQMYYCNNPNVGASHTFTFSHVGGFTAALAVQAFSGVGTYEATSYNSSADDYGQPGLLSPNISDLCVIGASGPNGNTAAGSTVDSNFTITDTADGTGFTESHIGMAYLFYDGGAPQAYSPTATYFQHEVVSYLGINYVCIFGGTLGPGFTPPANPSAWTPIAQGTDPIWEMGVPFNYAVMMATFSSGGSANGGIETKFYGTITRIVDINRVHVEFEVGDPLYLLNMRVPRRLMQPNCPWSVTDSNCTLNAGGMDINGFEMTQAFTLASGTQYLLFPAMPFAQPEGYFTQGVVTCTAGNNNGLSQTVKVHASGELVMLNPWLLPVQAGDTFSVLVGCDHTPTTCTKKFGNLINFGGTPFVPPSDSSV